MSLTRGLRLGLLLGLGLEATAARAQSELEVTVSGQRGAPRAPTRDPIAASTVIEPAQLSAPGTDAAEVLARVPGAQVLRRGADADLATVSIRGATAAQLPVYLAGIRLNDEVTGVADLSYLPLWMLDRVEVYRGNAPPDVDQFGVAGALLFEPRLPRATELGAGIGAGSFGRRSGFVAGMSGDADAGALFAFRRDSAQNDYAYRHDGGTSFGSSDDYSVLRPNADYESYDSWAIGRYRASRRARLTLLLNGYDRRQGLSGVLSTPAESAQQHTRRLLGGLRAQIACGSAQSLDRCRLTLASSVSSTNSAIEDRFAELQLQNRHVNTNGQRVVNSARVEHALDGLTELGVGVLQELDRQRLTRSETGSDASARSLSRASASLARWLGPVQVLGVGALGCYHSGGEAACTVLASEGRLGARWLLTDSAAGQVGHPQVTLLGNVSRYVRVPTLGETSGVTPLVRGNPELVSESGLAADVGLRSSARLSSSSALWLELFGFARSASDLIVYRNSGFGSVRPYNVGSARVLGAELVAGASALRHVRAELTATLLDPRDTTPDRGQANDLLTYTSRLSTSASLEIFAEPALPALSLDRAAAIFRLGYRSSRVSDPAGLIVLPEQADLDIELNAVLARGTWIAKLLVDNAIDQQLFDAVGFPQPGRSVHAALEAWWR